jgi:hypothetical protein
MSQPWMKFYPSDWRADPALRTCSLAARGLWIEMLALMHEAQPYGHLLINSNKVTPEQLAVLVGAPAKQVREMLLMLAKAGVYSIDEKTGDIISRRMLRDKAKAERDKANGKGGGNPRLKQGVNPQDNRVDKAQIPEARSQKPESNSELRSGADAPRDFRAELFSEGLKKLAAITGKTPDSSRSLVGKWLKSVNDEAIHVLGAIEDAERNRVADPVAWINRALQPRMNQNANGRRSVQDAAADLHARVAAFDEPPPGGLRDGTGKADVRLLPAR